MEIARKLCFILFFGSHLIAMPGSHNGSGSTAIDAQGRILFLGSYPMGPTLNASYLIRVTTDGTLDSTFADGGKLKLGFFTHPDEHHALALKSDGRILVLGTVFDYKEEARKYMVSQFNTSGTLDHTFGQKGSILVADPIPFARDDYYATLLLDHNGKILVAGASAPSNLYQFDVRRFNQNGSIDPTFGEGGRSVAAFRGPSGVHGLTLYGRHGILAYGVVQEKNVVYQAGFARFTEDGALDTRFGRNGTLYYSATPASFMPEDAVIAEGDLFVTGWLSDNNTCNHYPGVIKFDPSGEQDLSFGTVGIGGRNPRLNQELGTSLIVDREGKINLFATHLRSDQNSHPPHCLYWDDALTIARLGRDGQIDRSFANEGSQVIRFSKDYGIAADLLNVGKGKYLATGYTMVDEKWNLALFRFFDNGALDASFGDSGKLRVELSVE